MSSTSSRVLASWPVEASLRRREGQLRVLAYHGVPDPGAFDRQMNHLAMHYTVVSGNEVASSGGRFMATGRRPWVWITFDDGDPTVVDNALPVLDAYGFPATMFICPSVVGTDRPLWFDLVPRALARTPLRPTGCPGDDPATVMACLKEVEDEIRRVEVARLEESLSEPVRVRQLTLAELQRWVGSGRELGNHSWDHPCLDRCTPAEVARQIERAAAWLDEHIPGQPKLFAYPNGNWSAVAEQTLEAAGCSVALLFDHRTGRPGDHRLRSSRLRVSSDAPLDRFKAIVSGAHPQLFQLLGHHRRETSSRFPGRT